MSKQYINPKSLFSSLPHGFSQIVTASGQKTIYISGQTAWNAEKQIVGGTDLAQQAKQALQNMQIAVEAAGGSLSDIVALRIYIVGYKADHGPVIQAALMEFFRSENKPAATWIGVSALASPDFLIEIEATALLE